MWSDIYFKSAVQYGTFHITSGNLKQKKAKKQLEKIDTKDEIEPQHDHYKTGLYVFKIIITITFQKQALRLVLHFSQPSSKGYNLEG